MPRKSTREKSLVASRTTKKSRDLERAADALYQLIQRDVDSLWAMTQEVLRDGGSKEQVDLLKFVMSRILPEQKAQAQQREQGNNFAIKIVNGGDSPIIRGTRAAREEAIEVTARKREELRGGSKTISRP